MYLRSVVLACAHAGAPCAQLAQPVLEDLVRGWGWGWGKVGVRGRGRFGVGVRARVRGGVGGRIGLGLELQRRTETGATTKCGALPPASRRAARREMASTWVRVRARVRLGIRIELGLG